MSGIVLETVNKAYVFLGLDATALPEDVDLACSRTNSKYPPGS